MMQARQIAESPINVFRNPRLIACAVFVGLLSAVTAYYHAFFSFAPYDDEGTMMWGVKRFFEGSPLYDQVPSVYGPVYYFYEWCAHALTGTPLSHHSVRLVSIFFWVVAALVVFLLAYRTTGSLLLATLTHILAFRAMEFIGREPAHPQEVCTFLLAAIGFACFVRSRSWRAAVMGALAGAAVATKINFGIFVVMALSAGFAYGLRPKWLRTVTSLVASAGMLVAPVLLMWGHLPEWWAVKFCGLVVLSLASALFIVSGADWNVDVEFRDILIAGVGFASTIAAVCWFPLAHGSTVHGMIEWLIVKPRTSFGPLWYIPASVAPLAVPWAATASVLAYLVRLGRVRAAYIAFLKVALGIGVAALCVASQYEVLINFAPPLLWLVATHSGKAASPRNSSARALLLLFTLTQLLYAYPVAGSQAVFPTVLIIPVSAICFSDGFEWACSSSSTGSVRLQRLRARAVQLVASLFLAAAYVGLAWQAERVYASFEPLGFPGTVNMRIDPDEAVSLRAIVANVNSSACHTLITEPGLFSFNMFTGKPAPAGLNFGAWVVLLGPAEQEGIVREVAQDPNACVIRRQDMVDKWTRHGDVSSQPLVRYISQNFRSALETGKYSFLVRKN